MLLANSSAVGDSVGFSEGAEGRHPCSWCACCWQFRRRCREVVGMILLLGFSEGAEVVGILVVGALVVGKFVGDVVGDFCWTFRRR